MTEFIEMYSLIEATPVARVPRNMGGSFQRYNPNQKVFSSFDDAYYYNSGNILQELTAKKSGRNNVITVGDCGMSTVNFSQFLSCLGMTVQETTTLTATFTQTSTYSSGYSTMTVMGCTPSGFSYPYCPSSSTQVQQTSQIDDRPKFGTRTAIVKRPVVGKSIP